MSIYALMIDGWERKSTWGYDEAIRSLYAQLTRNGNSDDDGPDVWLTPPRIPAILAPATLAKYIAQAIGVCLATVHAGMNEGLDDTGAHLRLPPVA